MVCPCYNQQFKITLSKIESKQATPNDNASISDKQKAFVLEIATVLNFDHATLIAEIDKWTVREAHMWITQHLEAYNNKKSAIGKVSGRSLSKEALR
jgi:hypothetical protein